MRPVLLLALAWLAAADAVADTPTGTALARSREAYNAARYDAAISGASAALPDAAIADAARLIIGRALLERFRTTSYDADLASAIEALRAVVPSRLDPDDRVEWIVGMGQWLFYTERFGAAAEMFEQVVGHARLGGPHAADRALDWWASALDRHAQRIASTSRERVYRRILDRVEQEVARNPASVAGNYWRSPPPAALATSTAPGNPQSPAGCAPSSRPTHAATLRTDLDRLVLTAIIPDRARSAGGRDQRQAADTMVTEWERFKSSWNERTP
jgi:hypothetical protein